MKFIYLMQINLCGVTCYIGLQWNLLNNVTPVVDYSFHLLFSQNSVVKDDGGNNNVAFGELMGCTLLVFRNSRYLILVLCFNARFKVSSVLSRCDYDEMSHFL